MFYKLTGDHAAIVVEHNGIHAGMQSGNIQSVRHITGSHDKAATQIKDLYTCTTQVFVCLKFQLTRSRIRIEQESFRGSHRESALLYGNLFSSPRATACTYDQGTGHVIPACCNQTGIACCQGKGSTAKIIVLIQTGTVTTVDV